MSHLGRSGTLLDPPSSVHVNVPFLYRLITLWLSSVVRDKQWTTAMLFKWVEGAVAIGAVIKVSPLLEQSKMRMSAYHSHGLILLISDFLLSPFKT
jgi:hypothetical protein